MPAVRDYQSQMKKYAPKGSRLGTLSMEGFLAARLLVEALKATPKPVTAIALRNALETRSPFDLGGINASMSKVDHVGLDFVDIGIVTFDGKQFYNRRELGLVGDNFNSAGVISSLKGECGIGHVRYPTAGSSSSAEAQPFYVNSPYGITLAHNGNLTNAHDIAEDLFRADLRHINTDSDSEVLLNVLAHELQAQGKLRPNEDDIFQAKG